MDALGLVIIKSLLEIVILLTLFAGIMLFERKILGWFTYRVGPTKTGPWGLMQPLADGVKMFFKEDIIPTDADKLVFWLAPIIALFVALTAFAFIPIGPAITIGGKTTPLAIVDVNAGMLAMLAITSLGVYGLALAGWASQSKYALLGSLRATAQMISYELAMGMSVLGVIILTAARTGAMNGLRFTAIVDAQSGHLWNIIPQFLGFVVFYISTIAESNRTPFDLPEAEAELVAGYHTEYSGMRFATFTVAEYINLVTVSTLVTIFYLGGWNLPGLPPSVIWTVLKVFVLIFVAIWIRATLPRMRYDQLMNFGWKVMLPLAAVNLLGTAIWVTVGG